MAQQRLPAPSAGSSRGKLDHCACLCLTLHIHATLQARCQARWQAQRGLC